MSNSDAGLSVMSLLYAETAEMKSHPLGKIACQLKDAAPRQSRLSPLVFMTDPQRVKDLPADIARLPIGCAVIYRHFSEPKRRVTARLLRQTTKAQGQQLLIGGGDIELARAVGADGVHFKRDPTLLGPIQARRQDSGMIITIAGIKTGQYQAPLSCLDGLFISSIFPSRSPSAGQPIGIKRLQIICQSLDVPVFALGGISQKTAPELLGCGAYGFAAIGGFID